MGSAAGVVGLAAIWRLIRPLFNRPNHPAVACGHGFPSLSKEESLLPVSQQKPARIANKFGDARLDTTSGLLGDSFQHNGVGFRSKKSDDQSNPRHGRRHEEKHGEHAVGQEQSNDKC